MENYAHTSPRQANALSRRSVVILALALALAVFLLDQWLKGIVEGSMRLEESVTVIPGIVYLTYIKNAGGAFGILSGSQLLLLAGSVIATSIVLWMLLAAPPSRLTAVGCGLILGGAAGNLLDRLTSGEVTDYVDLRVWPIFNAADAAIVVGVAVLLLAAFWSERAVNYQHRPEG